MPKYRKKPVIVEAFKLSWPSYEWPEWWYEALREGTAVMSESQVIIKTLEGDHLANKDDYVVMGIKGELYPVKPNIFEATYELVLEETNGVRI